MLTYAKCKDLTRTDSTHYGSGIIVKVRHDDSGRMYFQVLNIYGRLLFKIDEGNIYTLAIDRHNEWDDDPKWLGILKSHFPAKIVYVDYTLYVMENKKSAERMMYIYGMQFNKKGELIDPNLYRMMYKSPRIDEIILGNDGETGSVIQEDEEEGRQRVVIRTTRTSSGFNTQSSIFNATLRSLQGQ